MNFCQKFNVLSLFNFCISLSPLYIPLLFEDHLRNNYILKFISELQIRLQDESIPVEERLDVAQKVFCSTILPIVQKEEQILLWICKILQDENTGLVEREICYDSFLHCFKSNRIKSFNGNIRSSSVSKILQVCLNLCITYNILALLS